MMNSGSTGSDAPPPKTSQGHFGLALTVMGWWFWLVGTGMTVLGAVMLWSQVRDVCRGSASSSWPKVRGEILSSKVEVAYAEGAGNRYDVAVSYRYIVAGTEYTSNTLDIAIRKWENRDRKLAEAIARRYPVGAEVDVRYMPSDPSVATLETGVSRGAWALVVFLAVMTAFGLAARCAAGWMRHRSFRDGLLAVLPFFFRPLFRAQPEIANLIGEDGGAMDRDGRRDDGVSRSEP